MLSILATAMVKTKLVPLKTAWSSKINTLELCWIFIVYFLIVALSFLKNRTISLTKLGLYPTLFRAK